MTQSLKKKDAVGRSVARPKRRTQAERSGETRRAVLETTIRCLHAHGYAATTTLRVAKEAGLSRGAMLHQFPTRVDLMIFVVQTVFDDEVALYDAKLAAIQDPRERLFAFPEILWEVLSRPSGVAVLEILQGSRSDPAVAERLAPVQAQIERTALAQVDRWYGPETTVSKTAMRLVVWAVRGLSIAKVLASDPEEIHKSVALLSRLLKTYVERPRSEQA